MFEKIGLSLAWSFIKAYWPFILGAVVSIAFWGYGEWKHSSGYRAGKNAGENECLEVAAKQGEKSVKVREKTENETRKKSDPDVINELSDSGWLRNDADR